MKYREILRACIILGFAVLTSGCRKELCYNHEEHSMGVKQYAVVKWERKWEYGLEHDWNEKWPWGLTYSYEDLIPEKAERITAISYMEDEIVGQTSFPSEGGRLPLMEGVNDVLLYNSDTEKIVFEGFSACESSTATTRSVTRASLGPLHAGERTIGAPDELYGCFMESYTAKETMDTVDVNITMKPLTYTYVIKCEITKGSKYVALARGALAGMAENIYLNDGRTGRETATLLFDCNMCSNFAEAYVKTFGVPNFDNGNYTRSDGKSDRFTLNIELMLTNGKIKSVNFDVTDQLDGQPRGGVIIVSGIEISDAEGENSGGFDVNVGDWGEYIDIPMDFD